MLEAFFDYQFLRNAVLAVLLSSLVCGVMGVLIMEKKVVMMSGGIAHTAYGGVGLGYLCGFEPIWGALFFAVFAAFGIGAIGRRGGAQTDIIIALAWSLGMALGIAFIGFMPGYPPDINSYLFGNILAISRADLWIMLALTAFITLLVVVFYDDWKAFLFDSEFSAITGIRTDILEYLLQLMIALTVVVLLRAAGIILVIAMLAAPAACASLLTRELGTRMALAVGFGVLFGVSGLLVSYQLNIASGAAIVIISVVAFIVLYLWNQLRDGNV